MSSERIDSAREVDAVIVEDSPTQAVLLRSILESAGYRVAAATNGRAGLV